MVTYFFRILRNGYSSVSMDQRWQTQTFQLPPSYQIDYYFEIVELFKGISKAKFSNYLNFTENIHVLAWIFLDKEIPDKSEEIY